MKRKLKNKRHEEPKKLHGNLDKCRFRTSLSTSA